MTSTAKEPPAAAISELERRLGVLEAERAIDPAGEWPPSLAERASDTTAEWPPSLASIRLPLHVTRLAGLSAALVLLAPAGARVEDGHPRRWASEAPSSSPGPDGVLFHPRSLCG